MVAHRFRSPALALVMALVSVFAFLRVRTWLDLDDPSATVDDVEALARHERLTGHAEAAAARRVR